MNEQPDAQQTAKQWAADMLRGNPSRSEEDIRASIEKAIQAVRLFGNTGEVDAEQLLVELLHIFSITAEKGSVLDDFRDHKVWLPEKRARMKSWPFWERYVTFLERDCGIPPEVVKRIHADTDLMLERIEDPERPGKWDRRGMVVGSVQSGKTANYIGLINKALDAGYKLIIVLAGRHNNLRSQTQLRLDEGTLGLDTKRERALNRSTYKIGVARYGTPEMVINYGTTSTEDGDFKSKKAQAFGVRPGRDPVILVIKKERSALQNVLDWLRHLVAETQYGSDQMFIRNVPLLLIDDEADNASINTKDKRGRDTTLKTVSAINGSIRKILSSFEKAAYVGYTATPFANIFVNPDAFTDEHGRDIFPESFIINIKAPSNYVGPARVFGLDGDTDAGIEARDGLPMIRLLRSAQQNGEEHDDFAGPECFPPKHNRDHVPTRLPRSLAAAIRCFILACAARRARGQVNKHNSMLIHVTRFVDVQAITANLVRDELIGLQRRLQDGDGKRTPTLRDELWELWESDFVPTSTLLGIEAGKAVTWQDVDAELFPAAAKIEVMTVNGFAQQVLDYKDHEENGRSVIAVGGDKLSRGLTLEGLSVSYFLRTSKMYDTLMQMGRWFGYRPGYLDLCRLFTTPELVRWYRHIALADAELRREFDYMVQAGLTPERYGLRVRTHPDGMIVTALNKMCHTQRLELSWAGVLVQTTQLPKAAETIAANLAATKKFLGGMTSPPTGENLEPRIWKDVGAERVAAFVRGLQFPGESARASGAQLAAFIQKQSTQGELTQWTVVLVSNTQATEDTRRDLAGQRVGLPKRTPESQTTYSWALRKANILSPTDESLDLEDIEFTSALLAELSAKPALARDSDFLAGHVGKNLRDLAVLLTRERVKHNPERWRNKEDTEVPNGRVVRELRPKSRGLLLIYPLRPPPEVGENKKAGRAREDTGLDPNGPPIIGLALSFPTSETAARVEYRVNKVWEAIAEDDAYEDDDADD
jgi:Z1 domain